MSALSVGAEAVSNAIHWISTEIRKTLEDDEDFSLLFSKPSPSQHTRNGRFASGRSIPGSGSCSYYDGGAGDHEVYVHRDEGVHAPPKTAISLDCLTSWQDSLEEEEEEESHFKPLPYSSSSFSSQDLSSNGGVDSKVSSSSSCPRISRKCSASTTASSVQTNRHASLHAALGQRYSPQGPTKEEGDLHSDTPPFPSESVSTNISSSSSTGCLSPPDGLTPPSFSSPFLSMKEEEEENLLHGADSAEDCSRRSYGTQAEAPSPPSPFPVDVDLNQKLYLFHGDMCSLRVDALVCFTNENFGSVDDLGRRLRAIGDEELLEEIRNLERCKAGEARICRSFNLPSSRIIYTVGPKFNNKYVTATHNALNACIREALLLVDEHGLGTVAFPFFIPKRSSPANSASSPFRARCQRGSAQAPRPSFVRGSQRMRDLQGRKSEEFLYGEETADNDAGHQRDHPRSWGSPEVRYGTGGSPQALGRGEREEEGGSRFLASLGGDETEAYIHTLLRSLRRWMEKLKDKITAVVLVVNSGYDSQEEEEDLKAYEHFVKLYFPRSLREERLAQLHLPQETGDVYGQIEVSERRIRIDRDGYKKNEQKSFFQTSSSSSWCVKKKEVGRGVSLAGRSSCPPHLFGRLLMRPSADDDEDAEVLDSSRALKERQEDEDEGEGVILRCTDVSFTDAQSSTETERRLKALQHGSSGLYDLGGYGWRGEEEEDSEVLYHRYLRQASAISNCAAFRQLDKLNFLYPSSTDKAGRRVVVFLAALFPSSAVDAGLVLLYIIKTLDPYIRDKYTLLYVNTEVHHTNVPCMALWKEFFNLFSKYENTLDQLLVLHPGLLFKAAFACCWPYVSTHVWNGTVYVHHVQDLYKHIEEKSLLLPNYVHEYDQKKSNTLAHSLFAKLSF